jgi:hypothetical protein
LEGGEKMLTEHSNEQIARRVTDGIEVDDFVPRVAQANHDQHAHYTHELSGDAAEASSRMLMRVVPMAYGIAFGAVSDNLVLGILAGLALSAAFDLSMGNDSLVRSLWSRLLRSACPAIARLARASAQLTAQFGLVLPPKITDIHCPFSTP